MNFKEYEDIIKNAYESGVTIDEAEKYAPQFLYAQIQLSAALKEQDLNVRMRKTGLKALRAAVYMDKATATDRKPSDSLLEAHVNMSEAVVKEQNEFDAEDVTREELQNQFNICKEAHIFFRGISKGRYDG